MKPAPPSRVRAAAHPVAHTITPEAGRQYRFDTLSLSLIMRDMFFVEADPTVGDASPCFDLPTTAGGRLRSDDLPTLAPVLLVFGSLSCPVTDDAMPGLRALHTEFGTRVRLVLVVVREAHPGEALPQPQSQAQKQQHAERLRALHDVPFEVAVDDLDGSLHRAFSPKPNSAYLLGPDGRILFRAHWANDTDALRAALADCVALRPIRRPLSGRLLGPMWRMLPHIAPVLDRAGPQAWSDLWRTAPPLAAVAALLKRLRILPGDYASSSAR